MSQENEAEGPGGAADLKYDGMDLYDYLTTVIGLSPEKSREFVDSHRDDPQTLQRDMERLQSQAVLNFFRSNSRKSDAPKDS